MQDLVNKDTDGDGIPDWQENLWGTDPTKKETTPGVLDSVAIEQLKMAQTANNEASSYNSGTENLTQTDKFSRELFSTVATLNQDGSVDQATIDKISGSLADHIQNSPQRKIYTFSDLKILKDNSIQSVKNYNLAMTFYKEYKETTAIANILSEFGADSNNPDSGALSKLNPIIDQINKLIDQMIKVAVPEDLAPMHLVVINDLEKIVENLNDIKLFDTDPIVTLSAVSQYDNNNATLELDTYNLKEALWKKLKI